MKVLTCETWGYEIMTGKPFYERIAIPYRLDIEKEKAEYMREGIIVSDMNIIGTSYWPYNPL